MNRVRLAWLSFALVFTQAFGATPAANADSVAEVNQIRAEAGMTTLNRSKALTNAAANHASYLADYFSLQQYSSQSGHDEVSGSTGFSGKSPSDRARFVAYPHKFVTENVSIGSASIKDSVESLMTAIYHRFGFLDFDIDEIGAADKDQRYVYNMGRRDFSLTCLMQPEQAKLKKPANCNGRLIDQSRIDAICTQPPAGALFSAPHPEACSNGALLDADYMASVCAQLPQAAEFSGSGKYYELCRQSSGGPKRVNARWYDALCANPPAAARYQGDGRYYTLCTAPGQPGQLGQQFHAPWFESFCADLPATASYQDSGRYQSICWNKTKIRLEYLEELNNKRWAENPGFVIWPASGGINIPPAFFSENPHPTSDLPVTGYPISLQFNPGVVDSVIIDQIQLEQHVPASKQEPAYWQVVGPIRQIDEHSDINHQFTSREFAWFPIQRLQWATQYRVAISALVNNQLEQIYTDFMTADLGVPMINIDAGTEFIDAPLNQWFAVYQSYSNIDPTPFAEVRSSHQSDAAIEVKLIDAQTIKLRVTADRCQAAQLIGTNNRQITINACG